MGAALTAIMLDRLGDTGLDPDVDLAVLAACEGKLDELLGGEDYVAPEAEDVEKVVTELIDAQAQAPSVVEAEERLAHAEEEVVRVRRLEDTLATTVMFLEQARDRVHRDIAPRLKRSIEAWLPAITGDRYAEAAVNPADLQVRVRAAGGTWRDAVCLSQGTAEQIYLLLRVAMAEHLVTTGEPVPLLLEDPTVQADRQRTEAILDLLHELSADRQIIVFRQEDEVHSWVQANLTGTDGALIQLDSAQIPA